MNKIIGQIIALTKNIFLSSPDGTQKGMEQFIAGKHDTFTFVGGIGLSWWYTEFTFKILENLSFLINSEVDKFSACDHETIQSVIRNTLHEICFDENIFDGDLVFFNKKKTLFECKSENNAKIYGNYILNFILKNIEKSVISCCVVYAAPRITGKSFVIESEKIHIIHKNDYAKWIELSSLGYYTKEWIPDSGNFIDGGVTGFSRKEYDYIFTTEMQGTVEGNKFSASLKFRKLFSVISSLIEYRFRSKVMARPYSICMQIPHNQNQKKSFTQNEIGELFPYYASEITIRDEDISKIKRWYESEQTLTPEQRNRIEKCAHFINKGMNSSDIESYIHYFVALDALYGKVGNVFKTIEDGVNGLPNSGPWNKKISWLYELRNELVHGGSRYIEEWTKYMRYYRHFSSEPARDIEKLAFHALGSAPSVFYAFNKKASVAS